METRPWVQTLNEEERQLVRQCLVAAVDGPFFPDWEFSSLFGFERDEVRRVLAEWPFASNPEDQWLAVNSTMNNLLGYPHHQDDRLADYTSVGRDDLDRLYLRIQEASGAADETRAYLRQEVNDLAALPKNSIIKRRELVKGVVGAARRYGVEVPANLAAVAASE